MDFFKDYIQKHKWLLFLWIPLNFIIIFLPQWLDSVWSLAEKILGQEIAMSDITWTYYITVPVGLIMFIIAIWAVRSKKTTTVEIAHKSENLADTLTMMHRRLVELQKEKASHTKVRAKQLEDVLPTLADRMGTVKFKDWPKFKRNLNSRIRKAIPQRPRRLWQTFNFKEFVKWRERVHVAALSEAVKARDELFHSKEWKFEDVVKISEWLDGYEWGVKKLRDNDSQWKVLHDSISHYRKDKVLRDLIERHIDFSYIYNNESLIVHYSGKFLKNVFSLMLHETLVGSPISPEKAEMALGEVLGDIDKRLEEIQKAEQSLVLTIRSWAIGLTGMTGYPKEPANAAWLLLEVSVNAIDKPIDTLDVIIGGKTIPANHWFGRKVTAFNAYFNVSEWHYKGNNQVELIAYVGDKMHRSGRITIDFNVEVWGKHLI